MSSVSRWLLHPWLTVRVQIALGVIFVAASLPKLVDPPSFAQMIYNYRLLPGPLVNPVALILPWIELLTGIALILGIWRRTAAVFIGAMLLVFIIGIGINLARNNPVNCGCFDLASADKPREVLIGEMKTVLLRDVGMLLLVAQILAATQSKRGSVESSEREEMFT
ncbi:MAG TPA: MauE/DoxX family redox-associated membrane protein [Thermoanaerobaculia bacterium]|nr:MauE/DoxX family redox-associated membrane protein [Thermoanaerobaculia bacterium]